jgi:F1F0 ATPase subunit 2
MGITLDWLHLGLSVAAGAALGTVYFGGLWLTVRSLPGVSRPALWTVASFVVRTAVVAGGFVAIVLFFGWPGAIAAMATMIVVRVLISSRVRRAPSAEGGEGGSRGADT